MTIEVLYNEICGLNGDSQNATYLRSCLPDSKFIFTALNDTPYFVSEKPDMILIGSMSEATQRKVIDRLLPYKERIMELVESGTPILATGNAGEIFAKHISYVTEGIEYDGLGIFDLSVKTNLFDRYNGKALTEVDGIELVGFRSQFSFLYGDNSDFYFSKCLRGVGINRDSKLEGMRHNNLICTQLLGPIVPLNPLFCEYLISLAGGNATAAFKDAAMDAYNNHLREFHDPSTAF